MVLQSNYNQITKEKRRYLITEFLKYCQGCSKEEVVKGVSNDISKKTVYKILDSLIEEQLVRQEKSKPNSRAYQLFLDSENLTILVPSELREFQKEFIVLVDKIFKLKFNINLANKRDRSVFLLKDQFPEFIFSMLVQSYVLLSIHHWPKQIKNKENLQQITSEVFLILSSFLVSLNESRSKDILNKVLKRDEMVFSLSDNRNLNTPIDKIVVFYGLCQENGLKKEYDRVLDIIWKINKDVQYVMFSKLMDYDHTFNFGKDHWQELIIHHLNRKVKDPADKKKVLKYFNIKN